MLITITSTHFANLTIHVTLDMSYIALIALSPDGIYIYKLHAVECAHVVCKQVPPSEVALYT